MMIKMDECPNCQEPFGCGSQIRTLNSGVFCWCECGVVYCIEPYETETIRKDKKANA